MATLLLAAGGCGSSGFQPLIDPAPGQRAARTDSSAWNALEEIQCRPDRTLRLVVVFEGTDLSRELSVLDLEAGQILPPFDSGVVGVGDRHRSSLTDRIVELVADAYNPFGIDVRGDGMAESDDDVEVISRVILTQIDGGPRRCRCQGATDRLGLSHGKASEGLVLANAFRQNGLTRAISGMPVQERIELIAVALANSIVHEAGHTFGLVHLDIAGAPTLFMARGGAADTLLTLEDMTTIQTFSSAWYSVTQDARSVRDSQCDSCVLSEIIEQRRFCGAALSTN